MAGIGPEDLHALAQELLDACVESLNTIPTFAPALGGAPERSFIAPGLPSWDCCEQLTVHSEPGVAENDTSPGGLASGRRAVYGRINLVGLVASLTRCIPTTGATLADEIPDPDDLQAAAAQIHADGWALWNHIYNMQREGEIFARCDEVYWDGLRAFVPLGGCAGWTLNFRLQLDGYED